MPLGRKVVILGALVMATGMALILLSLDRYGTDIAPWQLSLGLVVAGLGMAMVAGTLLTIVLAKVPEAEAGAASALINTSIQVGVAAGVALVGTVYFGRLDDGHDGVESAVIGMAVVIGLYLSAAVLALALPPGDVRKTPDPTPPVRRGRQA